MFTELSLAVFQIAHSASAFGCLLDDRPICVLLNSPFRGFNWLLYCFWWDHVTIGYHLTVNIKFHIFNTNNVIILYTTTARTEINF